METKYEVISIFPIPIYVNKIPKHLVKECIFSFDQEPMKDMGKEYGSRSNNTYIFSKQEYKKLGNYILHQATYYAENIYNYNYKNYKFSQSWLSQKKVNENHTPHIHHNSLISGVMYYDDFNEIEISPLVFNRNDPFSQNYNSHKNKPIELSNQFSSTKVTVFVKPNMLILFPSTQTHSVPINKSNKVRKSLAFNIVPKNGFGVEDNLTELKFNN